MAEQTSCHAYFSICSDGIIEPGVGFIANKNSDFDPEELTKRLGIQPFRTSRMGSPRRTGHGTFPFSSWHACLQKEPALDGEEQCLRIVRMLTDKIPVLNEIRREGDVEFALMIVTEIHHEEQPVLCFGREIIAFCYLTGTEISLDQFIYGEESRRELEVEGTA